MLATLTNMLIEMSEQNDSVATVHSIVSADYKLQTNRPSSSYCCRCTALLSLHSNSCA